MLVITPLNSLFKIICLALAFFTVIVGHGDRLLPNRGEYLAMILLGTTGLMLLVGSEELLMIFIGPRAHWPVALRPDRIRQE